MEQARTPYTKATPPPTPTLQQRLDSTSDTTYTITLANSVQYSFYVTALNANGLEGAASNTITVTYIAPPDNLRVSAHYQAVDLSWDWDGANNAQYRVHRATESMSALDGNLGSASGYVAVDVSERTLTIRELTNETEYYFRVTGVVAGTESAASAEATATPVAAQVLDEHTDDVYALAFRSDGLLASGSADNTIRLWRQEANGNYSADATLDAQQSVVRSLAFRSDGLLASGSADNTVRLWQQENGNYSAAAILRGHTGHVRAVAFSPDGILFSADSLLATGNTIRQWRREENDYTSDIFHQFASDYEWSETLAFSPDGGYFASGVYNFVNTIGDTIIWRKTDGVYTNTRSLNTDRAIFAVAFSPDSRYLAGGGNQRMNTEEMNIWNVADWSHAAELADHSSDVQAVAFSPDGRYLAGGADDNTVRIWNVADWSHAVTLADHSSDVRAVAFSPDGRYLASGAQDNTVRIWKMK